MQITYDDLLRAESFQKWEKYQEEQATIKFLIEETIQTAKEVGRKAYKKKHKANKKSRKFYDRKYATAQYWKYIAKYNRTKDVKWAKLARNLERYAIVTWREAFDALANNPLTHEE